MKKSPISGKNPKKILVLVYMNSVKIYMVRK